MTLTTEQLIALAPLWILALTVVAVLGCIAWQRHHFFTATVTVIGLNLALLSLGAVLTVTPIRVTPLLSIDNYTVLYSALILVASLASSTLAQAYLEGFPGRREEFYLLLLCAAAGAITLAASRHLAALFIGLELVSVPIFGMAAYTCRDSISLEAGIKYMVLSAAASTFLLFGMALTYAVSGSLAFADLATAAAGAPHAWLLAGLGMIIVAVGFKLSLAPFHLWTPDVYGGAPAPVATFLSTVSKVAVFAMLVRLFQLAPGTTADHLHFLIAAIALISMLVGNLLALRQNDIKRLLGYSSIAHLGYALTMVAASGGIAVEAAGVYLATYILTMLGAFGAVTLVSSPYSGPDAASLHFYRGLFWRRPYLASILTVMMLSLAGIPLTAGFIGKFYALATGVQAELWWLVAGIVAGSGIGLYYYLRMTITMYMFETGLRRRDAPTDWGQRSGGVMVLLIAIAVLAIGIYPQPLIRLVNLAGIGQ